MSDPADRFRRLWAAGTRPDLESFVSGAGPFAAAELAAVIRADQAERWAAGRPIPAEEYLRRFPAAAADPEAAVDLIHNEYLLAERHGTEPDPEAFVRRFPAHADTLRLQFALHREMATRSAGPDQPPGPAPSSALGLPPRIGRYRIVSLLGRGGMGAVYAAHDGRLGREVALKVPAFGPADRPAAERFLREARIAAGLNHPNLCPVYDVGEEDGVQYLTMPVLPGDSLAARLRREGRLPPAEAVRLAGTVARAMAAAHAGGVVHRDLKPANILLDARGGPVVTDFGLARRGGAGETGLTASGVFVGTAAYAAPEQLAAVGPASPAADVYALGGILYECLAGRLPFDGPADEMLRRKLTEEPVPPSHLRPGLDPALDRICSRALARAPDRRFGSMDEFAAALDGLERSRPVPARRAPRWPLLAATAVGAVALVAAGLVVGLGGCKPSPTGPTAPPAPAVDPAPADPLAVGSRWAGTHSFTPERADSWEPAGLRVTHRDGEAFRGEASTRDGGYAWEVAGTVRGRAVRWTYVKVIREATPTGSVEGKAYAEGELTGDRLEMRYHDPRDGSRAVIKLTRQQ